MAFTIQKCISFQKKMKKVCFASCTFYLKILNFLHEKERKWKEKWLDDASCFLKSEGVLQMYIVFWSCHPILFFSKAIKHAFLE